MDEFKGMWTPEIIEAALKTPIPTYKYIVTNDKAEFVERMSRIIEKSHKATGDNLSYLENITKINQIKSGEKEPEDVFEWLR